MFAAVLGVTVTVIVTFIGVLAVLRYCAHEDVNGLLHTGNSETKAWPVAKAAIRRGQQHRQHHSKTID